MIREYITIKPGSSLDELIERLSQVRRDIPNGSTSEQIRLRGDDVFGRHILVSYARPETEEERARRRRATNPTPLRPDCLAA